MYITAKATYQNYGHLLPNARVSNSDETESKMKMKKVRNHIQTFYFKQSQFIVKTHDEL